MHCITACAAPRPSKKHNFAMPQQRTPKYKVMETTRVEEIRGQIAKFKRAQQKIQMLTTWSRRSTQSSLKDLEEILETLEELYGDEMFD